MQKLNDVAMTSPGSMASAPAHVVDSIFNDWLDEFQSKVFKKEPSYEDEFDIPVELMDVWYIPELDKEEPESKNCKYENNSNGSEQKKKDKYKLADAKIVKPIKKRATRKVVTLEQVKDEI
jgi:hypothetical protein